MIEIWKMRKIASLMVEEMHIYWKHGQTFNPYSMYQYAFR